ncbi:MAG: hypothetical protein ACRD6X_19890 [Pyrinomonadaceae bacterium]
MVAKQSEEVIKMKAICLITIVTLAIFVFIENRDNCSFAQSKSDWGPKRLVLIKGKATIMNHPDLGVTPFSGGTIVFQKVGCDSCYIATNADVEGKYEVTVGDGKYKIIVRNPSSPEFDMLAPDQERFIDTETLEAKQFSKQVFNFDVKIRLPK